MKKIIILMLMSCFFFAAKAQDPSQVVVKQKVPNKVVFDKKVKAKILIGQMDRKGLHKKLFTDWFDKEYNSYTPKQEIIEQLSQFMPSNAHIIVIMATWCSDSRREVPRLFKILDAIGFDEHNIAIYAVNKDFSAGKIDISKYSVKKVPTIIYYHYGYEAGRIIETPEKTIEEDLLEFTQKKGK